MPRTPEELDVLRELRAKSYAGGGVFWIGDGELGVFDPDVAQKVNAINFSDLTLPDKLADLLRGRKSTPFSWKQLREAWIAQLRSLSDGEGTGQLAARMEDL